MEGKKKLAISCGALRGKSGKPAVLMIRSRGRGDGGGYNDVCLLSTDMKGVLKLWGEVWRRKEI